MQASHALCCNHNVSLGILRMQLEISSFALLGCALIPSLAIQSIFYSFQSSMNEEFKFMANNIQECTASCEDAEVVMRNIYIRRFISKEHSNA